MASTLTPTLINDDFQNWLKGALAVLFAKEGLIGLVGNEIIDFQRHLLQTLYTQKGIPPGTTCSSCTTANVLACPTAGFCSKGKKCKAHDSKVPDKKPNIACPNGVCFHIRDAIINEHRFKSPSWKNTDARKWCFDAFELSKCFMPPDGYFYKTSLEDTDFNGILAVVINNKRFQSKLSVDLGLETNICLKARNIGREIRYTTNHLLRAQDLMKYIDDLVALLSDPAILATDVHSKTAVGKLKQLKTNTLTINADDITNVLNENIKETIEDQQIAVLHDIQEHVNKIKRDSVEEIDRKIKESVDKMLADKLLKGLPPEILRMDKKSIEIYKQALAEGLPPEIKRMDEKSIELYKQALAEGSMPDYDVRVMIVGHSDVGKTTLKKRLFDETVDIMERKSTHGIKVHVGNCKVNRTSGEWIVQEEDGRRETLYQRLAELLRRNYQPSNPTTDTGENKEHDGTHESSFLSGLEANSSSSTEAQSPSHSVEPHMSGGNELDNKGDSSDRRDKEMCLSDLNEILRHSSKLDTIQETSELCIWDFAGQSDFYAMHQVFLSHRAVYLLVTKLTEHIDDDVDDQRLIDCTGKKYRKIGDLIEFWLNSIYEYVGNDDSHDQIPQNVILVGTHADQITEDFRKYSTSNFFGTVRMSLADKVTFNLLTEKGFLLNNVLRSTDPSSTISDIRKYILETASKQSYWGKPIPAKWCNLEKILMELRKEGTKILKVSDVVDLNKALPVPLDSDEIDLFLRVHHERGNILFYRNDHQLQENIILDPQWLIDAFKSIMTSCSFCCTKQNLAKKWAEFEQTAVLQSQLIEFIWKQEGYSEFRQHSTLILCFMEKLGLIAKPYQSAMPEETQTTVDYFVPYFLKIKPPEEILNTKGNKAKYSSKLCITTKSGFLPNTIFNKLLAACIQNFKPSGPPGRKHIYCGCGVFDVGTNCHQMFVCFADHVIHIWFSRLSSHENPDNLECKKISDFILNILRQDLKEDVIFYKCWKASVESKVKLFQENLPQNNEVICYCQNDGHSVKYSEITQYWQTQIQENADNVLASLDLVLPSSSQSTPQQESSCALSGQPFRKESDKTLVNQSMIAALNEQMKSVGVLISNGDVMGTVFRIGSKYVMTAYHVVKCIIDPHNTRSYDVSQLYNKRNTFVHFNESAVLSDRSSSVKKLVMFTEYLDVAVLKIKKEHDGHLPPKMVLSKFRFVGSDVSLIGYGNPNNSNRKHIDLRCEVVKPNSRRMQHVLQSLLQNNSHYKAVLQVCGQDPGLVDIGYRGYDNESQLMFDCYMQFGASGAPMLTNNNEGDIQVVGVFTHGLPEFFFKLPDSERQKFLPFYLLDGGSKMEYIYKWIHDNYHDYVNEFFN